MDQHSSLIAKLLKIPGAIDAINAALEQEFAATIKDLRNEARAGDSVKAAFCEGRLSALEGVPNMLTDFAKRAPIAQE